MKTEKLSPIIYHLSTFILLTNSSLSALLVCTLVLIFNTGTALACTFHLAASPGLHLKTIMQPVLIQISC